jgi:hypothetical protein
MPAALAECSTTASLEGPSGEVGEDMIAMQSLGEQKGVMDDCTELTGTIIGAAMEVHNYWGGGIGSQGADSAS